MEHKGFILSCGDGVDVLAPAHVACQHNANIFDSCDSLELMIMKLILRSVGLLTPSNG